MASYIWPDRQTIRQMLEVNEYEKLTDLWISVYDEAENETYRVPVLEIIGGTETIEDGGTPSDTTGTGLIENGRVNLPAPAENEGRVLYIKKTARPGQVELYEESGVDDYGASYSFGTGKLDCRRLVCDGTQWWLT